MFSSKYDTYVIPIDIHPTDPVEIEHMAHQLLNVCLTNVDKIAAKNLCELYYTSRTKEIKHVAILCVGHIARVYKSLVDPTIIGDIKEIALDPTHIHYGVANDTLDDIEVFVSRIIRYDH
jgi:hypothetical protein